MSARLVRALLPILGACGLAGHASAAAHHGEIPCAHAAAGYLDGCAQSPGGQFLAPRALDVLGHTSWQGYAAQSGQHWISSHPWPWDQAGIDYPIGPVQPKSAILGLTSKDPNTLPAFGTANACTYKAGFGAKGGGVVNCQAFGSQTTADLEGYDFSVRGGILVTIQASITNTTLKNDWFKLGPNNDTAPGYLLWLQGGGNVDIENCMFDGDGLNYTPVTGTIANPFVGMIDDNRTSANPTTFLLKYSVFINTPTRPISANAYSASRLIQYSYFERFGTALQQQHQEIVQDTTPPNSTVATEQYSFSTILQPHFNNTKAGAAGIAIFSGTAGNNAQNATITYSSVTFDHMVEVNNTAPSGIQADKPMSRGMWIAYNTFGAVDINENYVDPTDMYWTFSTGSTDTSAAQSVGSTNWHGANSVDMLDGLSCTGWDPNGAAAGMPCGH